MPSGRGLPAANYSFGNPRYIWDGRDIMTNEVAVGGDESGLPAEIHHPDGSAEYYDRLNSNGSDGLDSSSMHNSNNHWVFSKTDERGQTIFYRRDARRRVKQIDYPDGSHEFYTYNDFNQVETHTLPSHTQQAQAMEFYQYDGFHRLFRTWNSVDGPNNYTEYTYDTLDRVAKVEMPLARSRGTFTAKMEYNGRNLVTKVTYPATEPNTTDPFVTYEYDKYGNCTAITNELGHRSTYTYDMYRRCTSYTEPLNAPGWNGTGNVPGRTWNWVYDRVAPNGIDTFPSSAHTSPKWRLQIEPPFNSTGDRRATARDYDCNDRMNFEFVGIIVPSQGAWNYDHGAMHRYAYDGNGQKRSYVDPKNRETTYDYDNRNRLWKSNEYPNPNTGVPRTTTTLYNAAGDKTKVTFPDGESQEWPDANYDAFGQPHVFIDERHNTTNLDYWNWGSMKKLSRVTTHRSMDSGGTEHQETLFYYDPMGRPQTTVFPDTTSELRTYEFGQVSAFKTRRNQTKRLHYDARGREDYHTWDLDAAPRIDRIWDRANRLSRIWNNVSIIDYQYDEAGQAKLEGSNVAGSTGQRVINYYRYPSGEVSQMTYPNGTVINRNYTVRGRLQGVGWGSGSTSYAYLPDGKVDFQAWQHGEWTKFEYDPRGMIGSVRHKKNVNGPDLAYREYWRDNRDRITAWKRGVDTNNQNGMEDGRGDRYHYDAEGQLDQASYRVANPESSPGPALRTDIFTYDQLGNRVRWNRIASRGWMDLKRRDNKLNQYTSWENNIPAPDPNHWGTGTFYDDNIPPPSPVPPNYPWVPPGNGILMQDGYITAAFNALNQPTAMWSFAYWGTSNWMMFGYDPLGRCVKRWVGTNPATFYYYDGWNLVQEGPAAGTAERIYVHGGRVDEIVASAAGGTWYYHHYDARTHCILLTDTGGNILEQYDYDAFGRPYFYNAGGASAGSSAYGNRFLFTGREWINDMRLYDYRNRMYQPELGRFLQPDPKQFEAGDYNLYRYCHNDPVNRTDPFGLKEFKLTIILRPPLGSNIPRVVTFQGYTSAILAGKAGGKTAAAAGTRVEMHGRMASVDSAPGWYVYGPAVRGTISKDHTMNESDIKGEAAGPIPIGTHDAGMYWVLAQHQDPYSWPVNKNSGLSDGQVLRNAHRTGVLTNPPPKGGGQFTYHWYDAGTNKEGY